MKEKVINATRFKAECLALLDEVNETGTRITITKRGRAVAVLTKSHRKGFRSPLGLMEGKIENLDALLATDLTTAWGVLQEAEEPGQS